MCDVAKSVYHSTARIIYGVQRKHSRDCGQAPARTEHLSLKR